MRREPLLILAGVCDSVDSSGRRRMRRIGEHGTRSLATSHAG